MNNKQTLILSFSQALLFKLSFNQLNTLTCPSNSVISISTDNKQANKQAPEANSSLKP